MSGTNVHPLRALFLSTGLYGSRSGVEAPELGSVCLHIIHNMIRDATETWFNSDEPRSQDLSGFHHFL